MIRCTTAGHFALITALLALLALSATAPAGDQSWVDISNGHTNLMLRTLAEFSPESIGRLGVDGLDEEIPDARPGLIERNIGTLSNVLQHLRGRIVTEKHPLVRQDIGILIGVVEQLPHERHAAAVVRIKRYAGLEYGYSLISEPARALALDRFDIKGLQGPFELLREHMRSYNNWVRADRSYLRQLSSKNPSRAKETIDIES